MNTHENLELVSQQPLIQIQQENVFQNSTDQSSILLELQKKTQENNTCTNENDDFQRRNTNNDQIADNNETGSFGDMAEVFTVLSSANQQHERSIMNLNLKMTDGQENIEN